MRAYHSATVLCTADCADFDKVTAQWYVQEEAGSDLGIATLNLECDGAAARRRLRGSAEY
jgi:hypothetical protein